MVKARQVLLYVAASAILKTCHLSPWNTTHGGQIQAIQEALALADVHQLKAFIGLLNFYSKFLPNMATTLNIVILSPTETKTMIPWPCPETCLSFGQESAHIVNSPSSLLRPEEAPPVL